MLLLIWDCGCAEMRQKTKSADTGVLLLCSLNLLLYACDHVLHLNIQHLYLWHAFPKWWQFLTSAFCHASWQHLSSNLFMLYVFGKVVEEEEGGLGVILTYLIGAAGASTLGCLGCQAVFLFRHSFVLLLVTCHMST